jgi:8-oxo-dGTP diphosphatase
MRSAYGASGHGDGEPPATIVVDVANVMGSRPDGWWRDRAGAAVRLHADLAQLAASGQPVLPPDPDSAPHPDSDSDSAPNPDSAPPEFVMVLEGAARAAAGRIEPAERVRVVVADGSGDDAIVALLRELSGRRVVVTADRELRRRSAAAGASAQGPGWLLSQLPAR